MRTSDGKKIIEENEHVYGDYLETVDKKNSDDLN